MKNRFFLLMAALILLGGSARAQVPAAETQALAKQLAQLMRNPHKPKQDVYLKLSGCHAEQIIRDRDADVQTSKPLAVSYNSGNSGWAMKMDNGVFEMKLAFDWADVTSLTYTPETDDDGQKHYQIKIKKGKKGSNMSFDLPLYTTSEATVKDVVRRLEKLRQSCGN
ncbi:hypothetical protein SAMN02745146_3152 [Hymenobacter daecheongensis DSM 21074]|uniref:DUF4468 domain-containing protein n=1 Tax=Hymenobacter daecheongensis DSM 21074 TaxID=1121955 RepID=A0A1M6J9D9_9BACT|nr:hypothetical protein [Hymenobacter daecheongensis]SHJ43281.1 hypothetical protein SAMN02745146_3152 [Hymenobacter daecheongensis DSM 21074]